MTEMTALEKKRKEKIETDEVAQEALDALIPKPVGYRLLIALPNVEESFTDKDRFPTGPWCKQGDFVMFRANTGTRFKVGNQEYRLMNDDSIEAIVDDPSVISRAS